MTSREHGNDVTLFAGLVVLVALIVGIVWCVRRHRHEAHADLPAEDRRQGVAAVEDRLVRTVR